MKKKRINAHWICVIFFFYFCCCYCTFEDFISSNSSYEIFSSLNFFVQSTKKGKSIKINSKKAINIQYMLTFNAGIQTHVPTTYKRLCFKEMMNVKSERQEKMERKEARFWFYTYTYHIANTLRALYSIHTCI